MVGLLIQGILAAVGIVAVVIYMYMLHQADETAKRQFRAYLLYERGEVRLSEDGRSYTVSIEVKNTGVTPAYSTFSWFTSEVRNRRTNPFKDFYPPCIDKRVKCCNGQIAFRKVPNEGLSEIGAGQSICIQKRFPTLVENVSRENQVMYVWGDVRYMDQFGRHQYHVFIRQVPIQTPIAKSVPLGNIMSWTSDPTNDLGQDNEGNAKIPWPEKAILPGDSASVVFQGPCPN